MAASSKCLAMGFAILIAIIAFLATTSKGIAISSSVAEIPSIYQFPPKTWVENIAVRSNGNLILVLYDRPEVYELNPLLPNPMPKLLHRFENGKALTGAVETVPDVFITMVKWPSGFSIASVDLTGESPLVKQVIPDVVGAKALNGLTKISQDLLLAADTSLGGVWAFDLSKGTSYVAIQDATMKGTLGTPLGINGVRYRNGYLYYTNSSKNLFARIPVDPATGRATGPAETVSKRLSLGLDDFALGLGDGDAYVMAWLKGEVDHVDKSGVVTPVGRASWPTSGQFGRAKGGERTLYITSSGNPLAQAAGTFEGPKLYALKV